jgi:hypothetical protein
LHLIQDHIKVNNFAQAFPCKFLLNFKLGASKVATLKQKQDHPHFVILQINSNLTTTTTSRLQLLYVYNPPKFIQKFENIFLAGILSSTLWAGFNLEPMLNFFKWTKSTLTSYDPSTPCPALETRSGTDHHHHLDQNMPCRGMAWTPTCSPSLWSPQPCTTVSSHLLSLP